MSCFLHLDSFLRRVLDVLGAGAGLLILGLPLLLVALAILLRRDGPVFYRARRVGRKGREFELLKFRTMRHEPRAQGPAITAQGDSRVTPLGRILRKYKVDELPQLLNVLWGEMSLVGPRPEDPRYVALYSAEQRRVLEVRPGITSAASLAYRNEEEVLSGPDWESRYRNEVLPDKLRIDLDYLARRTVLSDCALVLRTLGAVIR